MRSLMTPTKNQTCVGAGLDEMTCDHVGSFRSQRPLAEARQVMSTGSMGLYVGEINRHCCAVESVLREHCVPIVYLCRWLVSGSLRIF